MPRPIRQRFYSVFNVFTTFSQRFFTSMEILEYGKKPNSRQLTMAIHSQLLSVNSVWTVCDVAKEVQHRVRMLHSAQHMFSANYLASASDSAVRDVGGAWTIGQTRLNISIHRSFDQFNINCHRQLTVHYSLRHDHRCSIIYDLLGFVIPRLHRTDAPRALINTNT